MLNKIKKRITSLKGSVFFRVGMIMYNLNNFYRALFFWNYALEAYLKTEDKFNESQCYTNIGNMYYKLGYFDKSIKYHKLSIGIDQKLKDNNGVATCYINLGAAYFTLGEFNKAVNYHKKALLMYQEMEGKLLQQAECYNNIGSGYDCLGKVRRAIEYYEKAIEISKNIKGRKKNLMFMGCYLNLGVTYQEKFGDLDKASKYYNLSLSLAKRFNDLSVQSACYMNLGAIYSDSISSKNAVKSYEKALKICEKINDNSGKLTCHAGIGDARLSRQEFEAAKRSYEIALAIAKKVGDKSAEAACYSGLSNAYSKLEQYEEMLNYREKSLKIARNTGDIYLQSIINFNLGLFYSVYKPQIGLEHFKRSIELSEITGKEFIREKHKLDFYHITSNVYEEIILLCWKLRYLSDMFHYLERSKSKTFLDLLSATEIIPSKRYLQDKSLLKKEKIYIHQLNNIRKKQELDIEAAPKIGEVDAALYKLKHIYDEMERIDPEYVFMRQGKSASFKSIKEALLI